MDRITFVRKLKRVIEEHGNCYTQTTFKKGEGFVPYNVFNVKWGQVDVEEKRIRVVIDLYPGQYDEKGLSDLLALSTKAKRKRNTGFYFEKTEEREAPFHDVVFISLYDDFFESKTYQPSKLLSFMVKATSEASFKTDYPEKLRSN